MSASRAALPPAVDRGGADCAGAGVGAAAALAAVLGVAAAGVGCAKDGDCVVAADGARAAGFVCEAGGVRVHAKPMTDSEAARMSHGAIAERRARRCFFRGTE